MSLFNKEIARALGLKRVEYQKGHPRNDVYEMLWVNTDESYCYGKTSEMVKWLDSPEGREKIRDRVRALCTAQFVNLEYMFDSSYQEPHRIILRGDMEPNEAWHKSTESSAWLAALEFLAKEGR